MCAQGARTGSFMGATERRQELARQAIADDRESLLPFLRGQDSARRLSPERSGQKSPEADSPDLQQGLYVRERSNLRPRDRNPAGDAPYFSTGSLESPGAVGNAAMPVAQFSRSTFGPAFARTTSSNQLSLLQNLNKPAVCTDLRGNISFWNPAAEQFYQWNSEEVIGTSIVDLVIPPSLKKLTTETLLRIAQGESWSGQYPCLRRDGVMLNSVVTKTPLVDDDQKIIGILILCVEGSVSSQGKTSIKRSYSDEGLSQTIEEEGVVEGVSLAQPLNSVLVEHQLEADTTGRNLLKLGRSSVQQLLRKLHIGGGIRWDEEDSATPRQGPERQNSWESEHEVANEFMQDCDRGSHISIASSMQNDSFQGTVDSSADGVSLPLIMVGQGAGPYMMGRDVGVEDVHSDPGAAFGGFQVLSRTSSGSAANSVSGSPNIPSVQGSSVESKLHGVALLTGPARGVNFQQAEEDFQLQMALTLRVAAEAAAVDDPDLSANMRGPLGSTRLMPGVTRVEATAYRYWVSNCLGYEDRIEDGFYEVWGMSPYVWSMCTDSNELGRMPPMESLRSVSPTEAAFEVVLVDRNSDPDLKDLEERVVGLAYKSEEVSDLAKKLAQMVANVMGGAAASDDELMEAWRVSTDKLTQRLQSIVFPIGMLRIPIGIGLSRHRALLFKVMADSVGLPCRLVRGSSYCDKQDDAMVVVKLGDDREWMVDLLAEPGHIMPPDARLSAPPTVIASPLQFERPTPFAGSSVSVLDWARNELGARERGIAPGLRTAATSEQAAKSPTGVTIKAPATDAAKMGSGTGGSPRAQNLGPWRGGVPSPRGSVAPQPFDFTPLLFDQRNSVSQIAKEREQEKADSLPRDQEQSRGGQGQGGGRYEEYITGPSANQNQELSKGRVSGDVGSVDNDTSGRANERGASSSQEEEIGRFSRGKLVENAVAFAKEFEIPWEDLIIGERIGQGSYGKVYRADWQGSDVAVKVFLDQDLKVEALEEFKSEVAIMRRLRHPNVVLFMGAVTRPPNLSIITEFCPRGSLYRLLHRPNRELDPRRCVRMALDVVKGMNYLHRSSPPVVHRDLKSPNLLVDKNWTVKVCDFGLSRLKHSTFLTSKSSAGTPEWMAPEVLRNELSDEKSDVYSFGVILWELATLQQPWAGMNPIQVVGAVGFQHRRLPIPDSVDPSIANIIQACWRMDPRQRPSFSDIMQELKPLTRPGAGVGQPPGQKQSSPSDTGLD